MNAPVSSSIIRFSSKILIVHCKQLKKMAMKSSRLNTIPFFRANSTR